MSDTYSDPNYHEITQLSNRELAKRTKAALDTFIQVVEQGGDVAEKEQLYNAYQDEHLKRLNIQKISVDSEPVKHTTKNC
jgi:hypothetical protein